MPTEPQILDEKQIAEIEARPAVTQYRWLCVPLTPTERDALCQTVRALRADVDRFSTLADERHDLLSVERRANDELRAERARILESLERAQQERNRLRKELNARA